MGQHAPYFSNEKIQKIFAAVCVRLQLCVCRLRFWMTLNHASSSTLEPRLRSSKLHQRASCSVVGKPAAALL